MAQGIVASRSQALLIDLCAAVREQRSGDKLYLLLQLGGLLSAFALPEKSAQAEMVAARLQQRYSLEERKVGLNSAFVSGDCSCRTQECFDRPNLGLIDCQGACTGMTPPFINSVTLMPLHCHNTLRCFFQFICVSWHTYCCMSLSCTFFTNSSRVVQEILEDYHGIDPARADRMAELLGFDPALVLSALQQPHSATG